MHSEYVDLSKTVSHAFSECACLALKKMVVEIGLENYENCSHSSSGKAFK